MNPLPPVSCARYQLEEGEPIPGYRSVHDLLQDQRLLGRLLPNLDRVRLSLDFWIRTGHPCFLTVQSYVRWGDRLLVIFDSLRGVRSLGQWNPRGLRPADLGRLFRQLALAFHFLSDQGCCFPNWTWPRFITKKMARSKLRAMKRAAGKNKRRLHTWTCAMPPRNW